MISDDHPEQRTVPDPGHATGLRQDSRHSADTALIEPVPVALSSFTTLRREATRPLEFRDENFATQFDDDTLIYDSFRLLDGRVMLIGPPFLNLKPLLAGMTITALPSGQQCRFRMRELDRNGQIIVDVPSDVVSIAMHVAGQTTVVSVQQNDTAAFAGKRVLFTQSKNNQLHWIRDWISYHRDIHGADAVLLYDNGSTRYRPQDVLEMIAGIDGISAARVVNWPFKFGPQGTKLQPFWDSDFCQHGVLEHARWRFLQQARSAHNADIDELMVSPNGRSVFETAENNFFGVVGYRGRWVIGTQEATASPTDASRAHRNYDTVLRPKTLRHFGVIPFDDNACPPKWTAVPARCPTNAQWGIHSVFGWLPSRLMSSEFSYRHFREISDNWKYDRADRHEFDPSMHEKDQLLQRNLERVNW